MLGLLSLPHFCTDEKIYRLEIAFPALPSTSQSDEDNFSSFIEELFNNSGLRPKSGWTNKTKDSSKKKEKIHLFTSVKTSWRTEQENSRMKTFCLSVDLLPDLGKSLENFLDSVGLKDLTTTFCHTKDNSSSGTTSFQFNAVFDSCLVNLLESLEWKMAVEFFVCGSVKLVFKKYDDVKLNNQYIKLMTDRGLEEFLEWLGSALFESVWKGILLTFVTYLDSIDCITLTVGVYTFKIQLQIPGLFKKMVPKYEDHQVVFKREDRETIEVRAHVGVFKLQMHHPLFTYACSLCHNFGLGYCYTNAKPLAISHKSDKERDAEENPKSKQQVHHYFHPFCARKHPPYQLQNLPKPFKKNVDHNTNDADESFVSDAEVCISNYNVIGLYFSKPGLKSDGHLNEEKIIQVYKHLKQNEKSIEFIYISNALEQVDWMRHFKTMPWLALDFVHSTSSFVQLVHEFGLDPYLTLPKLVLVSKKDSLISVNGVELLLRYEAAGFPYDSDTLNQIEHRIMKVMRDKTKDHRHKHLLRKITNASLFVCQGCNQVGSNWAYKCFECNWNLHPTCHDKAEMELDVQLKQKSVSDTFCSVITYAKGLGLTDEIIEEALSFPCKT
eukprot:TRINITY_DN7528_c0_g1_i5.p1 TRINITY_DN7528_c0_g1~~TRINITY_DN7528_c0_g1_i5.p1  ORF type:complete len:610 (-),score=110.97 TRINITY_DN7528_c0_g1_i5:122-1951(-)